MSKKKLIIAIVVIVLLAIIAGTIGFLSKNSNSLEYYLDLGAKYIESQDYDEAISAYTKALEIDDMSVEAYLGLADAYVGRGDIKSAIALLKKGYEKTNSIELQNRINELSASNETEGFNSSDIEERFPLTSQGLELVKLIRKSDGLTLNGKSYSVYDFLKMNSDDIADVLDCDLVYNEAVDYSFYEVPEKYGNCWFSYDDNGYTLDVYAPSREGQIVYDYTASDTIVSEYGWETQSSSLYYEDIIDVPDYLNGKKLFQYISVHNLSDIDSLVEYFSGKKLKQGKTLYVNAEQMVCYYLKSDSSTSSGFIEIDGVGDGTGDIDIIKMDNGTLWFMFYPTNTMSKYHSLNVTE